MRETNVWFERHGLEHSHAACVCQIGFKSTFEYKEPRLMCSLRDIKGNLCESEQETPISTSISGTHIHFDNTVHIQTPIHNLPQNYALFFEFMHYKPTKKKLSCKVCDSCRICMLSMRYSHHFWETYSSFALVANSAGQ